LVSTDLLFQLLSEQQVIYTKINILVNAKAGYSSYKGYAHLAAGLSAGLSCLASGMSIGIVGDAGVRAYGKQQGIFVALLLILIFAEALALYGLIVALVVANLPNTPDCPAITTQAS
jgi:V-type H+-transporting ATPase 16kDa proteolipid subunit